MRLVIVSPRYSARQAVIAMAAEKLIGAQTAKPGRQETEETNLSSSSILTHARARRSQR
jgi:hypothetical protein